MPSIHMCRTLIGMAGHKKLFSRPYELGAKTTLCSTRCACIHAIVKNSQIKRRRFILRTNKYYIYTLKIILYLLIQDEKEDKQVYDL